MSERIATGQWGSHWRLRVVLLIVVCVLVGYGWILADQWRSRTIVSGSGNPAVLCIQTRRGISLEAYDWKAGKRWHVVELERANKGDKVIQSLRAVGDGKAVAWHVDSAIHIVDLAPPHGRRRYDTPIKGPTDALIGVTPDERFAVFESHGERVRTADGGTQVVLERTWGSTNPAVVVHRIVDLDTGAVISTRAWDSTLTLNGTANEFLSRCRATPPSDPDEPAAALWRITAGGEWEKIESRDSRFGQGSLLSLARDQQGKWRLLETNEVARSGEDASQAVVVRASRSGGRVLLFDRLTPCVLLMDTQSAAIRELTRSHPSIGFGEFVDDDKAFLMADLRDDVRLIDTQTGKLLAIDGAGSQRRNLLVAVAALLLLASAFLLGTAVREGRLAWTLADVLAACIATQMAVAYGIVSVVHPDLVPVIPSLRYWVLGPICGLFGGYVGISTAIGLYWAFGRNWLPWRWFWGVLALGVAALPIVVISLQLDGQPDPFAVLAVTVAFGLVFAGVTNLLGTFVRSLGYTLRDVPVEENPRQYKLATFFIVVAGIAVLVVVGKWLYSNPSDSQILVGTAIGVVTVLIGMFVAGVLFSNLNRWSFWGLLTVVVLVAAAMIGLHGEYPSFGPMSRYEIYILDVPLAAAVALSVAIPCLVLRMRGWRWRRAKSVDAASAATLEAAT